MVVLFQLEKRKEQYEAIKDLSVDQIVAMYSYDAFKEMQVQWRKSLEMTFPKDFRIDAKLLVEFH